jgi:metal-responsive CopG/Arc/MetJ family transcriptional regulator
MSKVVKSISLDSKLYNEIEDYVSSQHYPSFSYFVAETLRVALHEMKGF